MASDDRRSQDQASRQVSAVQSRASSLASSMDMDRIDLDDGEERKAAKGKARAVSFMCVFGHDRIPNSPVVHHVPGSPVPYPSTSTSQAFSDLHPACRDASDPCR